MGGSWVPIIKGTQSKIKVLPMASLLKKFSFDVNYSEID